MQQLNRELERAKEEGTPAQEALAKLGMSAKDLQGLDADERMAALADRIKEMGLSSGQASDILRDLGVRSRNMALLLIQGGDAIRSAREEVAAFGLELTKTQTDSIESANDAVARMGLVFDSLRQRLAVEVAPMLQTVADRFNTLAQSDAVQTAIERLAAAFGDLAEIILSEGFIEVAINGLTGLANVSATAAEAMVTVANNVEIVTLAFSGLAIAVAAAGGPLTVVAGLLAVALGGIAAWRSKAEDMAEGTDTAVEAQNQLNEALGVFAVSGAPSAGAAAIKLASDNRKLAESALAAAEAELAKREAMFQSESERISAINSQPGGADGSGFLTIGRSLEVGLGVETGRAELDAARAAVDLARARQRSVVDRVTGEDYEGILGGSVTLPSVTIDSGDIETPDVGGGAAGLSTADQLREQLEMRLEVLTEGLATEAEVVAQWHEEGQTVLEDALAKGLLTEEEYREQRERLEEEHQKRMNAIKQAGAAADLATVAGAGAEILNAIGQNNKKALKIAKVFGAAEALISTYAGAANALKLPFPQNLAAAASIIAKGIGFVNAIKSVGDNGSSGGGGGSTGASSVSAAPAIPTQTVSINLQGDTFSRGSVEGLLEQIQSQLDRGGRLVFS
jgi:hypothetical protein